MPSRPQVLAEEMAQGPHVGLPIKANPHKERVLSHTSSDVVKKATQSISIISLKFSTTFCI